MKKKLLLCLFLLLSFSVFAQKNATTNLPPDELKLRTDLESDKTILTMGCGLFTELDLNHPYAKQSLELQKQAIEIRRNLYSASQDNNKTIKVKTFCGTDEGDTVVYYLIVEKGKVRYIGDYSRDPFGGLRVNSYDCDKLSIGYFVRSEKGLEFTPLKDKIDDKKIPVLQCRSENRNFIF